MRRRPAITGMILSLALAGTCAASQDEGDQPQQSEPQAQESDGSELIEITIRLPDGRIIRRKEPRMAARRGTELPNLKGDRPPIVTNTSRGGDVNIGNSDVSGGSNSSSVNIGGGSAGGGGGSSQSTGGGGGGGGSGDSTSRSSGGGHSGGNTGDSGPTAVQPDMDFTVRFYAWDNSGSPFDYVQEALLADPRSRTPERLAQQIASQVRSQQPDKVVIRFWQEFDAALRNPFDISSPRELLNARGFTAGMTEYWTQFAIALRQEGVTPDYLIFDQEHGISFWHIPQARRREYFTAIFDPSLPLCTNLPPSLRGVNIDSFIHRNNLGSPAYTEYEQFAQEFRADMIRRVFVETFENVYGAEMHASNYRDINAGDTVYRYTGRAAHEATIDGISAPVAYIDDRGENAARYSRTTKHQRWNRLIDALNAVRATAQPGLTTPWIAPPGYGRFGPDTWARASQIEQEEWLWEQLMSHMLAMGVDTFILWNPSSRFNPNAADNDRFMDQWLAEHPVVDRPQSRSLEPIPLDADDIETNGVVTRYEDYVAEMGITQD